MKLKILILLLLLGLVQFANSQVITNPSGGRASGPRSMAPVPFETPICKNVIFLGGADSQLGNDTLAMKNWYYTGNFVPTPTLLEPDLVLLDADGRINAKFQPLDLKVACASLTYSRKNFPSYFYFNPGGIWDKSGKFEPLYNNFFTQYFKLASTKPPTPITNPKQRAPSAPPSETDFLIGEGELLCPPTSKLYKGIKFINSNTFYTINQEMMPWKRDELLLQLKAIYLDKNINGFTTILKNEYLHTFFNNGWSAVVEGQQACMTDLQYQRYLNTSASK
jgi:hypothetical protein